ncbi:MAG: DinB family protein [Nostocoides sp.]
MRPNDPRGFSLAWDAIERLWDGTVERARSFAVRQAVVRRVIDELSPDRLQETLTSATPVAPDGGSGVTVARCLRVVLNEEWEHRLYAERDLTALTALTPPHTET